MDPATVGRLSDLLAKHEQVAIAVGREPTLDSMAAALSLFLSLRESGKNTTVASPTPPIVALSSLVGIDKVKTSFVSDGGDLVVSFPYQEGAIEKVSYTIEDGFLNLVVKAGERGLAFSEKDVVYKRAGTLGSSLLFIVGTERLSDLGHLFDPTLLKDATVVNIDNQRENQGFGDVVLVSSQFSSVCEQVASLLTSLALPIDVDTAQNLLSGMMSATDNFQKPQTSYLAFEMAAALMRKGAVRKTHVQFVAQEAPVREEDFVLPDDVPVATASPLPSAKVNKGKPPADWLVPRVYKGSTKV